MAEGYATRLKLEPVSYENAVPPSPDWRERYLALHQFVAEHGGVVRPCGLMELRQIDIWAAEARRDIEGARD